MKITLDITKKFNSVVNHAHFLDWASTLMNPVIFFENPFQVKENFSFDLMNFGLNLDAEMEEIFVTQSLHFDDTMNFKSNEFVHKSLLIFGRARFNFTGLNGLYIQFGEHDKVLSEKVYHEGYMIPKVIERKRNKGQLKISVWMTYHMKQHFYYALTYRYNALCIDKLPPCHHLKFDRPADFFHQFLCSNSPLSYLLTVRDDRCPHYHFGLYPVLVD